MKRVLLCGGEPALAEELNTAFHEAGGFAIVACPGGAQSPSDLVAYRPDIILLDAGEEPATRFLSMMKYPTPLPIVLRMRSTSAEFAFGTVTMGVRGVIFKSASIETLRSCLTSVSEGELWFDRSIF